MTAPHGAGAGPVLSGRHRESKALERLLATPGGGCASVLVQGGWGSGKTSVLRAALAGARDDAATRVVSASADPLECDLRYAVVRQLFERLVADGADSPYGGRTPDSARRPAPWEPRPSGPSGPMAGQDAAALRDLYQLAARLTSHGRLLVAVDDLQWSDTASLRWLRHLLHRADDLPLVVVATLGPEDARSNSAGIAAAVPLFQHRLTLGGLSDEAVECLAEEVLGEAPEPSFTAACRNATGGNLLLVDALLRGARAAGRPVDADLAPRITELVPADLGPAVLTRIEGVAPHTTATAEAVAVLGGSPSVDLLTAVTGLTQPQVEDAAHVLVRADCLTRTDEGLSFRYDALAAAVASAVLPSMRMNLHVRAARFLLSQGAPLEQVAGHLLHSPLGHPWVPQVLTRAAATASEHGDTEKAMAFLKRALREELTEEARASLLASVGRLELSSSVPVAVRNLERSLELSRDPADRAVAARGLAGAMLALDRYPDALETLRRTGEDLRETDSVDAVCLEVDLLHIALTNTVPAPAVVRRLMELDISDAADTRVRRHLAALLSLRAVMVGRSSEETVRLARLALSQGADPMADESVVYYDAVLSLRAAGETELALEYTDAAARKAQARGSVLAHVMAMGVRAYTHCWTGRLRECQDDAMSALEELAGIGIGPRHSFSVFAIATLTDSLVKQGEHEAAEELLRRGDLSGALNANWVNEYVLMVRGRLRVAQGRLEEGLADFLLCGERTCGRGFHSPAVHPWRSEAALVHAALRQSEAARPLAEEELTLARAWGVPETVGVALHAMGTVVGGQEGLDMLREAVELLGRAPARLRYAQALADCGVLTRKAGRLAEARPLLQKAVSVAHECGATPLADRALAELRAVGDRPRGRSFHGVDALTATERRVANLAAQGMTNREIAQHLFVGLRTVELHLTNVYGKLAIDGRAGLAHTLSSSQGRRSERTDRGATGGKALGPDRQVSASSGA
ncbi:ATP-binding protein [Kitasatospora sp. NPDC018058]|uniref:ATP-binding protein n=1 Tax=Kitasatospora sp. NPDC018058 TaxID=3364025 RepID=UPI0037BEC980